MALDIKAPTFPESVVDGTVATWHKQSGESVRRDELLVDIETDKVVMEVLAEADGVLTEILCPAGATVQSGQLLGRLTQGAATQKEAAAPAAVVVAPVSSQTIASVAPTASPAARKLLEEGGVQPAAVVGTGKDGRITKEDAVAAVAAASSLQTKPSVLSTAVDARIEKRVPMTRLRAKIAERLVEAQSSMAMLTTFNEVDMTEVMALRARHKVLFEKTHAGARLGFMSFFVKACVEALKRFPAVNASIDGTDIVYHGYQDIGVAVSSDRGLVVPVLRDAQAMNFAQIESGIAVFGEKARDGKLSIEEMTGGTFTITNGGTFGSMMSTPIVNPPQAAILGMHNILKRPMAIDDQVVVRPMMYLALSYDHRLIDGKEAVSFLVVVKHLLEDPARLLLEI